MCPVMIRLDNQEGMLRELSNANFRTRTMLKRTINKPINVLFVCHEPALWSMFETVYRAMAADPEFYPLVVTLPYKHSSLPAGQYKDAEMLEFCGQRKVRAIRGYDKEKKEWLDPGSLMADYVFFQTPYNLYPKIWSVEGVSMMSKVCYIPYGTVLFGGGVDRTAHPTNFFRYTSLIFKESPFYKDLFVEKFQQKDVLIEGKVILAGHPKLDYVYKNNNLTGQIWRLRTQHQVKRILWTPRWTTLEGNSHFFAYKDFFIEFCKEHQYVDFVFRPHPLCMQHFIQTGELTEKDISQMETEYESSLNMTLDKTKSYQDIFMTSDILVSDISSMMFEYFVTSKPIIYTHRINVFNEFGQKLSEGFYWVKNSNELKQTLKMLISGNDPLRHKRQELMDELFFMPEGGSGLFIKKAILDDFNLDMRSLL